VSRPNLVFTVLASEAHMTSAKRGINPISAWPQDLHITYMLFHTLQLVIYFVNACCELSSLPVTISFSQTPFPKHFSTFTFTRSHLSTWTTTLTVSLKFPGCSIIWSIFSFETTLNLDSGVQSVLISVRTPDFDEWRVYIIVA
jgi:hypothetical protein